MSCDNCTDCPCSKDTFEYDPIYVDADSGLIPEVKPSLARRLLLLGDA